MIGPLIINGEMWWPVRVDPGDPRLRDRTGSIRIATTDPSTRCVYLSRELREPFLDKVLLHEAGHCAMVSYGLLNDLHRIVPEDLWVDVEEWACNFLANYGGEIVQAVNAALPRPIALRV